MRQSNLNDVDRKLSLFLFGRENLDQSPYRSDTSPTPIRSSFKSKLWIEGQTRSRGLFKNNDKLKVRKIEDIKNIYKIGKVIHEGSISQIRDGIQRESEEKCVIKVIRKNEIDNEEKAYLKDQVMDEIKVL